MACDRLDIEFSATVEWKATPRRVLILMTQHSGICHFSTNSNYNMEECGQFVYVWCRQLREKKPSHSGHSAPGSRAFFSLSFPCTEKTSPDSDSSHHHLFPQCPTQEFQYSPVPVLLLFLPTAFPGRSTWFFFLIAFSIAVLTTEQYWWSSWY